MKIITFITILYFAISCSSSGEHVPPIIEPTTEAAFIKNCFKPFDSAQFQDEYFPSGDSAFGVVNFKNSGVKGGALYLSYSSENAYTHLLLGVEGRKGYYKIAADESEFIILLSQYFIDASKFKIAGIKENGEISDNIVKSIPLRQVRAEGLQVILSFDADKDLDLHLFTPSGKEIFYGMQGEATQSGEMLYGIDLMSNNDCEIDGIRQEHIFIPESYLESGTYRVCVNLYGSCTPFEGVNYMVRAIRDNLDLSSPRTAYMDENEEQNRNPQNYKQLMQFSISQEAIKSSKTRSNIQNHPIELDLVSKRKAMWSKIVGKN